MAIKKKDGGTVRFSRPNPMMKQQDLWDDGSPFILHNFNYQEDIILQSKPKPKYQPLDEIIPQEIKVPIKESIVAPEHKIRKMPKNVLLFYCLPATTVDSHDPLYSENRVSVSYGEQFTFEAVVTSSTDLAFQLWTTKKIGRNSIIFQPQARRWWKVEEVTQSTDGFIISCVPSSIQPSFTI